ncbi:hypothetical protein ROZALSC1DRAFT_20567 [Rozella allomycis CSF55]|uniref:CRAL-TRIO domain-containing protein n=1 Tax=Rozella allomycis (strain CSF55) TaxID=988480 RepID=A0A4P9YP43_ROZAC|nr:hypothetical protein ROZALSC1DRAFT_20567 [Rozella allomycis CSF55]
MIVTEILAAIFFGITGLLFLFCGKRLFKPSLFIAGFLLLSILITEPIAESKIGRELSDGAFIGMFIGIGLLGGFLAFTFWRIGLACFGGLAGFAVAVNIQNWQVGGVIPNVEGRIGLIASFVLLGIVLSYFFEELVIIVGTSLTGSFLVLFSADLFADTKYGDNLRAITNVNGTTITQGLDNVSQPTLAFFGCNMPNPIDVNYDILLSDILQKLDEYVENDYVLIMFNAETRHRPAISWLFKAYKSLDRKYRKNLKQLIVVHPSSMVIFLMNAMKKIISPKFGKKLFYVNAIADLQPFIDIKQIPVPNEVMEYDFRIHGIERHAASLTDLKQPGSFFKLNLSLIMPEDNLPRGWSILVEYIRDNGKRCLSFKGQERISKESFESPPRHPKF